MKRRRLAAASFALAASALGLTGFTSGSAHATPGALDPTFGTLGVTTQPGPSGTGTTGATGLAVMLPGVTNATTQAGDEVVSGTDGTNFQVARLTPSGAADASFGTGGTINAFGGAANAVAEVTSTGAGALTGDIIAVGSSNAQSSANGPNPCSTRGPVIAAFTPGTPATQTTPAVAPALDTHFGTGGVVCFTGQPGSPYSFLPGGAFNGVTIDPTTGNVIAAGQIVTQSGTVEELIQRLSPTGAATSFGTSGFATATIGSGNSTALAVALAPSGDVVTAGTSYNDGGVEQATATAFTSTGALDTTNFNGTGTATAGTATASAAYGLTIQGTATAWDAYLAGSVTASDGSGTNHPFLADFTQAGTANTGFHSTGQLTGSGTGEYRADAIAPGGILVAAGFLGTGVAPGATGDQQMLLAQYNAANGTANASFASGGQLSQSFASGAGALAAVAVQQDGKSVGAGVAPTVNNAPGFGLIRVLGPTLTVGNAAPVTVTTSATRTVQVPFTIDEPLFASTSPTFCVATFPGSAPPAGTSCTNVQVTLPANTTSASVPVTVTPAMSAGNEVTLTVTPVATNGFAAGTAGRGVVRRVQPNRSDGYWLVASDGGIFTYGKGFYGSAGNLRLTQPVVGMAPTPDGKGYWLVAADGGIFNYGDAGFFGSAGNLRLTKPIVGMAATPDGGGYWLVAADGGIFNYGDASFYGSAGNLRLTKPVVGMAATPDGTGYWLVASDGGIFNYGGAPFKGSAGALPLTKPIVGMAADPGAAGYWLVASDGGIFNYGDAGFFGSAGALPLTKPVVGMSASPDGLGYWLVASDGGIFNYGDAVFHGSAGNINLTKPIVGMGS